MHAPACTVHFYTMLTVYKASAGSGKTFRLAIEYIKLLIEDPTAYKNTLAVTFTNKATEEMKMRILGQLYGISHRLPDSRPYIDKITDETGKTEEHIAQRAETALSFLIHDYNYFRVETIDSFFQSILRNLARELDLTANLRIAINNKQLEQNAVDNLIEGLNRNSKELKWILSYIKNNIAEDKAWNVIGQLKRFGENIFKDNYKEKGEELRNILQQKDFFKSYTDRLRAIRESAKQAIDRQAEEFFSILEQNGLDVSDFSNGSSGACSYFLKLKNGKYSEDKLLTKRVVDAMGNPEKWVKKSDVANNTPAYQLASERLAEMLQQTEELRKKQYKLYKSADITLKHMYQLRLLNSIDMHMHEMNKESNRFLLSDTQQVLQSLIDDNDSPFIFEKIGTQLKNIMIDEFQDTSVVQWENFKVLLKECLSQEDSQDLIVGDVKQSIYRWRNGDWKLLNNIESQFNKEQLKIETLQTNFRSATRVIDFNNAFFKEATKQEYGSLANDNVPDAIQVCKAYADVEQLSPDVKKQNGYVNIRLLGKDDYQDNMLKLLGSTVQELLDNGTSPKSMAILVRSNQTIQAIADHFMQNMPHVKMVSDEAFRLDSSNAVNILIDALRVLAHPEDQLTRAQLAQAYVKNKEVEETSAHSMTIITEPDNFLPHDFTDKAKELTTMPIHDLMELLVKMFHLERLTDQNAYLCTLFDKADEYLQDHPADLYDFLQEWDDNMHGQTIQSDEIDGIRLLTIHKSKGLEYDTVIMPFCDWQLEKSSLIWCDPRDAVPFNELPIVPVDFSATQMKGTIYEPDYQHEHLQNVVDNLNLLYVAFTRARNNLYVFGKRAGANSRAYIIEKVLENIADELKDCIIEGIGSDNNTELSFEFGTPLMQEEKTKSDTDNVFLTPSAGKTVKIESFIPKVEFRQSNKSKEFINDDDEESAQQKKYIQTGNILHNIFSHIRTLDDIPAAIAELEQEGVLYDDELSRDKLINMLQERFNKQQIAEWFSDKWKLYNECTILSVNPVSGEVMEHRPDRVITDGSQTIVIDFKFGSPKPEYKKQVLQYMSLLKDMGHPNVSGFLWYVYSNKIENVL